jgi:hypothetical protein
MLLRLRIILFFVIVFSGMFAQKTARVWSFEKRLNQFQINDSVFFSTDDSVCVMKVRLNNTGTFDQSDCASAGDKWIRTGSWNPEPGKLVIETDSAKFVLRLIKHIRNGLLFFVEQKSERRSITHVGIMPEKYEGLEIDFRLGSAFTIIDKDTRRFIDNFWSVAMGAGVYYSHFMVSYSFIPTTLQKVKQDFPAFGVGHIKEYDRRSSNNYYWLDILRHSIDFGYEKHLRNRWSIVPSAGVSISHFYTVDSSRSHSKRTIADIPGYSLGCAVKKTLFLDETAGVIISFGHSVNYYDVRSALPSFGNWFYSMNLTVGLKFRTTSKKIAEKLLDVAPLYIDYWMDSKMH